MAEPPTLALTELYAALEDPRVKQTKLHPQLSIVVIALGAVIGVSSHMLRHQQTKHLSIKAKRLKAG